jgi:hypothetical protein
MKKFKCSCFSHVIDVDTKPLDGIDYVGLTIYEITNPETSRKYRKPKELGTVVLIGKDATKFRKEINRRYKKEKK